MSRLDDIEARLKALEGDTNLPARVAVIEECLGIHRGTAAPQEAVTTAAGKVDLCKRCGMMQRLDENFRCAQAKCPFT